MNLKEYRTTIIISAVCLFLGFFLLVVRRHWLILRWIPSSSIARAAGCCPTTRRTVKLYAWKDDALCQENMRCIWGESAADNIKNLVGRWLAFVYEERIISKRVQIESAALDESGQSVVLSFDRPLCEREWSIYKKWQLVKSLLKTMKMTDAKIKDVLFLVKQEVMQDDHLEFSQPIGDFE
jgi:hypothetical protein